MLQGSAIVAPVRNVGEAVRSSLAGALASLIAAIPRIIGFAVVLVVGWLVASLLSKAVAGLLHAIRFNDLARRSGLADFVRSTGVKQDSSAVIAAIAKWFVRLIALVVAFDTLGLPAVSGVLQQLLLWLPNLVVALVVLVLGGLAAKAVSRLVRGAVAEAGLADPDVIATVVKVTVWAFAALVALNQLGIARTLMDALAIGVIGAAALAAGLAFGLGGRERAAAILDRLSRRGGQAPRTIERALPQELEPGLGESGRPPQREGWIQRSGTDRRRTQRPGLDRRLVESES